MAFFENGFILKMLVYIMFFRFLAIFKTTLYTVAEACIKL